MIINRSWSMPHKNTFRIKPIKELIERTISQYSPSIIVDPYCNESKYGTITNDLNPEYDTTHHMDALDFLKQIPDNSADMVLYDPPY